KIHACVHKHLCNQSCAASSKPANSHNRSFAHYDPAIRGLDVPHRRCIPFCETVSALALHLRALDCGVLLVLHCPGSRLPFVLSRRLFWASYAIRVAMISNSSVAIRVDNDATNSNLTDLFWTHKSVPMLSAIDQDQ